MSRFLPIFLLFCIVSCSNVSQKNKEKCWGTNEKQQDSTITSTDPKEDQTTTIQVTANHSGLFEYTPDGYPIKRVFAEATNKNNCFFVISKVHPEHLSVYEAIERDTVIRAIYPVCIARNKGQKERKGDNKTPESYPGKPFSISQIQDAHDWHHDFGDGRGSILAYGHWFMRLVTPGFSGIGIHGSTNNRQSIITGRGSEGCIRLLDEDLIHLKERYAQVGTPVVILPEDYGPLPFELAALKKFNIINAGKMPDSLIAEESTTNLKNESEDQKTTTQEKKNKKRRGLKEDEENIVPEVIKPKSYVIVVGTRQQLRTGPTKEYPLYKGNGDSSICPEDGERLELLEELDVYYKVIFDGKELYINKISCRKEDSNQ